MESFDFYFCQYQTMNQLKIFIIGLIALSFIIITASYHSRSSSYFQLKQMSDEFRRFKILLKEIAIAISSIIVLKNALERNIGYANLLSVDNVKQSEKLSGKLPFVV